MNIAALYYKLILYVCSVTVLSGKFCLAFQVIKIPETKINNYY